MEISLDDLAGETLIVSGRAPSEEINDYLIQHLAELGHHPEVQRQAVGRDTLMQLLAFRRELTVDLCGRRGSQ